MKIFLTLFIIFMFFPIPLKFYIYYNNNCYYIKLYNFTLFNNESLKKKKEKIKLKKNNPPTKKKTQKKYSLSKLSKYITFSDIKGIINKLYNLKFKPLMILHGNFQYSFNDASRTAIAYGVLSNIPSIVYFFLNILFRPKRFNFEITPKFIDKTLVKFETKSIIFISFANIIYIIFVLVKYILNIIHKNKKTTLKKYKE